MAEHRSAGQKIHFARQRQFQAGETRHDFQALPSLSLYIHLPWCVQKCPYCDFNSHALGNDSFDEHAYINALIIDLEQELPSVWGRQVESIFLGGGTPSLFSASAIDQLLAAVRARLSLSMDCEISMEANPGTWEKDRFIAFRQAGVNRLSIGIQSFDDTALQALGRIHSGQQAIVAAEEAAQAGFSSWNIDLMFALPGQTLAAARSDLDMAIALAPAHISYYQLTLEANTAFYHTPPVLPDDESAWQMQQQGLQLLTEAAYQQYEISAFAQKGQQCRHNLNYWRFGDYLGIGAGAHGKISRADRQQIERYSKRRGPVDYQQLAGQDQRIHEQHLLSPAETRFEFMLNALRLNEGFSRKYFRQQTGLPLTPLEAALKMAEKRGLIKQTLNSIKPTTLGHRFLNDLQEIFLPEN